MEGTRLRTAGVLLVLAIFVLSSKGQGSSVTLLDVSAPIVPFDCGVKAASSASINWPWTVLLGFENRGKIVWFCNGILINSGWVVTSAFCLLHTPGNSYVIHLGNSRPPTSETLSPTNDIKVASYVAYPGYKHTQSVTNDVANDVALVRLQRPATFSVDVSPVCLPWGTEIHRDLTTTSVTMATWAILDPQASLGYTLTDVNADVLSFDVCTKEYESILTSLVFPRRITKDMLCVRNRRFDGGCNGNMGGPLVYKNTHNNNRYTVAGLVSFGLLECFPTFATSLQNGEILAWIKKTAF